MAESLELCVSEKFTETKIIKINIFTLKKRFRIRREWILHIYSLHLLFHSSIRFRVQSSEIVR